MDAWRNIPEDIVCAGGSGDPAKLGGPQDLAWKIGGRCGDGVCRSPLNRIACDLHTSKWRGNEARSETARRWGVWLACVSSDMTGVGKVIAMAVLNKISTAKDVN